jgi:hypothetical protein
MEHRSQIEAIVRDAMRSWSHTAGRAGFAGMWAEVRRQLRALRDTTTSLAEDERTALLCLRQFQVPRPPVAEAFGD